MEIVRDPRKDQVSKREVDPLEKRLMKEGKVLGLPTTLLGLFICEKLERIGLTSLNQKKEFFGYIRQWLVDNHQIVLPDNLSDIDLLNVNTNRTWMTIKFLKSRMSEFRNIQNQIDDDNSDTDEDYEENKYLFARY